MAHNQVGMMESTKRRLESGQILGFWMDNMLVISDKQV
jgi:hypothetical protein